MNNNFIKVKLANDEEGGNDFAYINVANITTIRKLDTKYSNGKSRIFLLSEKYVDVVEDVKGVMSKINNLKGD